MDIVGVSDTGCAVFFNINDLIDEVDGIPVQCADGGDQPRIATGKQPAESKGAQARNEGYMKP